MISMLSQFSILRIEMVLLAVTSVIGVLYRWKKMRASSTVTAGAPVERNGVSPSTQAKIEPVTNALDLDNSNEDEVQGTLSPSTVLRSNQGEATNFENDNCVGSFLFMHRPTHNPALEKSGRYPYAEHFSGRKRLWEARVQFKFKQIPSAPVYFGVELDDYVPLPAASKRLMGLVVAALRRVVGSDLYHSVGDDPKATAGPHEKPAFVMPLWAFDQLIMTPEGEKAPSLTDPHFHELGMKRADDRAAFVKEISALEFKSGLTYTFSFWGTSQFADIINWEVTGVVPFTKINFNQFCGQAPIHLVMYSLQSASDVERRHLQCQKQYFFDLKFWSSKFKPTPQRLKELFPREDETSSDLAEVSVASKAKASSSRKMRACSALCYVQ
jgi:hypothetical protein